MSKRTERKDMDYIKKDYVKTRTLPGSWYLSSYKYKFNITHMQPFLKKLKEKKLVGLQCSSCNQVFVPPRAVCGQCMVKPDRWIDIRDTGQVASFTISYLKDPETGEVLEKPMTLVRPDDADTVLISQLSPDIAFKDTYIGMPLKIHWNENENTEGLSNIEYYERIDDDSEDLELRKD